MLNKDISERNDKLVEIIKETKKKTSKPIPVNKLPQINPFNTDGLTEEEKRLRRDMIIKIRNYIDCFLTMKSYNQSVGIPFYLSRSSMKRISQILQLYMRKL